MKTSQQQAEELARKCAEHLKEVCSDVLDGHRIVYFDDFPSTILKDIPLPELIKVAKLVANLERTGDNISYLTLIDSLNELRTKLPKDFEL